mmetsp:Transcript_57448/g.64161  ORF Transcript_57448/g.64161 Transcript_57448/m.64161 type:complete len:90 (+) Transcript_57448:680-949(+)
MFVERELMALLSILHHHNGDGFRSDSFNFAIVCLAISRYKATQFVPSSICYLINTEVTRYIICYFHRWNVITLDTCGDWFSSDLMKIQW